MTGDVAYDQLAAVYEWLVPDTLLTPEGSVAALGGVVDELPPGGRVLDCAAGRGVDVVTAHCAWEALGRQGWDESFDAVFCVGNSLTHAPGRTARRAALTAMARVLRPGGILAVTSRNWERVRRRGSGLEIAGEVTERHGQRGLVIYAWTVPERWEEVHFLEVAVARLEATAVDTTGERLAFWPFSHQDLDDDLRASGLAPTWTDFAEGIERYLVTARSATGEAGGDPVSVKRAPPDGMDATRPGFSGRGPV